MHEEVCRINLRLRRCSKYGRMAGRRLRWEEAEDVPEYAVGKTSMQPSLPSAGGTDLLLLSPGRIVSSRCRASKIRQRAETANGRGEAGPSSERSSLEQAAGGDTIRRKKILIYYTRDFPN
jgi:hypothetical protein